MKIAPRLPELKVKEIKSLLKQRETEPYSYRLTYKGIAEATKTPWYTVQNISHGVTYANIGE